MGIIGARPGDISKCLSHLKSSPGSPPDAEAKEACRRVIFGFFLFPRLQRELENLKLLEPELLHPPKPWPEPDPPPILNELAQLLLAPHFGEPNPQPSHNIKARLETTKAFQQGLQNVVAQLEEEIERLEKQE
jgi:hypothetical protein